MVGGTVRDAQGVKEKKCRAGEEARGEEALKPNCEEQQTQQARLNAKRCNAVSHVLVEIGRTRG